MTALAPRRILILYWHPQSAELRAAIRQHLQVLENSSVRHQLIYCNTALPVPRSVRALRYDAVILHTTLLCLRWSHVFPFWKWNLRWVAELDAIKIAMPQDEYDHSEVLDEWLYEWGVDTVFSNFDEDLRGVLYPLMRRRAAFGEAYTGYIDPAMAVRYQSNLTPTSLRTIDIVYRASNLPYWFGSQGQLKHRIGEAVASASRRKRLKVDISTRPADTIVGTAWFDFLASGKAVIGCESGSSVLDRRGEIRANIQHMLREHPGLSFEEVSARMPAGWDDHRFLAISPRHLEAVIMRTCQILVEGSYDGVLEAGRHYIPMKPDLSDLDEVLDRLKRPRDLEVIANRAYKEVYEAGKATYRELAAQIEEVLATRPRRRLIMATPAARVASRQGRRQLQWRERRGQQRLTGWMLSDLRRLRVSLFAIGADPELRRVISAHVGAPASKGTGAIAPLLDDLLVLALVRTAQAAGPTAGEPYRVDLRYEADIGRLTIVSRRPGQRPRGLTRAELGEALAAAPSIHFDHSAIGTSIHHKLTDRRWLNINIGAGRMELGSLSRIAALSPQALEPALGSLATDDSPTGPGFIRRMAGDPVVYAATGLAAMRAIMGRPELRSVWLRYLSSPRLRRQLRGDHVLEDLFKLSLAALTPISQRYRARDRTLLLKSVQPSPGAVHAAPPPNGQVENIVWDTGAIGGYVLAPVAGGKRITVYLNGGRYDFKALVALRRDLPREIDAALGLVTGSGPRDQRPSSRS